MANRTSLPTISELKTSLFSKRRREPSPPAAVSMFIFVLLAAVANQSAADAETLAIITVEAGKHARIDTPVSATLEEIPEATSSAVIRLWERGIWARPVPVPAQIEPGNPARLWWIVRGTTPAGGKRIYQLVKEPAV
ncbi:MAG: hypothetical protein ACYS30_21895, partial [Planctomycetota bacterium]